MEPPQVFGHSLDLVHSHMVFEEVFIFRHTVQKKMAAMPERVFVSFEYLIVSCANKTYFVVSKSEVMCMLIVALLEDNITSGELVASCILNVHVNNRE